MRTYYKVRCCKDQYVKLYLITEHGFETILKPFEGEYDTCDQNLCW